MADDRVHRRLLRRNEQEAGGTPNPHERTKGRGERWVSIDGKLARCVDYTDYAALEAERDAMREAIREWVNNPTADDFDRAIDIIEHSKGTHAAWIKFIEDYPIDAALQTHIAGDMEHHSSRVDRYNHVLHVLRNCRAFLAPQEQK